MHELGKYFIHGDPELVSNRLEQIMVSWAATVEAMDWREGSSETEMKVECWSSEAVERAEDGGAQGGDDHEGAEGTAGSPTEAAVQGPGEGVYLSPGQLSDRTTPSRASTGTLAGSAD